MWAEQDDVWTDTTATAPSPTSCISVFDGGNESSTEPFNQRVPSVPLVPRVDFHSCFPVTSRSSSGLRAQQMEDVVALGFHVLTQVSQLQPRQNELRASHRSVQHSLFLEQRRMFGMRTLAQRRLQERVSRRGKKPRCLVSCSVGAR